MASAASDILLLAQEAADSLPAGVREWLLGWAVAVGLVVAAYAGRRRLPRGMSDGLFGAGISGAMLMAYTSAETSLSWRFILGAALTGLTAAWFGASLWIERDTGTPARPDWEAGSPKSVLRRAMGLHFAGIAGLLAAAAVLADLRVDGVAYSPSALTLLLVLAVIATGGALLERRRRIRDAYAAPHGPGLARYAIAAPILALLYVRPATLSWPAEPLSPQWSLLIAALLMLAGSLILPLVGWLRRRATDLREPERLMSPAPSSRLLRGAIVAICALIGLACVAVFEHWQTPLTLLAAGLAALISEHSRPDDADGQPPRVPGIAGEVGLILAGGSVLAASLAWLPAGAFDRMRGVALAGILLLWLARFWEQQVVGIGAGTARPGLPERVPPWTTAGRLIPAARRLSQAAAGANLALAFFAVLTRVPGPGETIEIEPTNPLFGVLAACAVLLHGLFLAADAPRHGADRGEAAACWAGLAAAAPFALALSGGELNPTTWLAYGVIVAGLTAVLLAVIADGGRRPPAATSWAMNAYLGGVLPALLLFVIVFSTSIRARPVALVVGFGGVLLAMFLRVRVPRAQSLVEG